MHTPTLGSVVIVGVDPELNNESDVCPAVVTLVVGANVNGGWDVNVKTVPDAEGGGEWKESVRLFETEEDARNTGIAISGYWPPEPEVQRG